MASRRTLKAAEAIRKVVSMMIIRDIQDPRVLDVTVTKVEVSGDMRQAKVYVSVMGSESKQNLCLKGLQNAAGFFQRKVADQIQTRYTPRLEFVMDKGVKNSMETARILQAVLPPKDDVDENVDDVDDMDSTDDADENVSEMDGEQGQA